MERLIDAVKFLADLHHKESTTRKVLINPSMDPEIRSVLEKTKIDKFLYDENLSKKLEEAKAIKKVGNDMKMHHKTYPKNNPKNDHLNCKSSTANHTTAPRSSARTRGSKRHNNHHRSRANEAHSRARGQRSERREQRR